ncbi:sterol carrier protein domain-containing protein, partial [Streptomyces carpinensis]
RKASPMSSSAWTSSGRSTSSPTRGGSAGGRWRLEASPAGASCTPTTRSADLTLDVGELAALWLGDESAVRLAALGRLREERAGAALVADALLRTSRRPWCPDVF